MQLGEIIRATKIGVDISEWKRGKIPLSAFGVKRKFPPGEAWAWRIVTFQALGRDFRLLIRLNREKLYYSAILALDTPSVIQVICHHEIHKGHRNWHCHFVTGDVTKTHPNVLRDRERMRIFDASPSREIAEQFDLTEHEALAHSLKRFRIPTPSIDKRQGELKI